MIFVLFINRSDLAVTNESIRPSSQSVLVTQTSSGHVTQPSQPNAQPSQSVQPSLPPPSSSPYAIQPSNNMMAVSPTQSVQPNTQAPVLQQPLPASLHPLQPPPPTSHSNYGQHPPYTPYGHHNYNQYSNFNYN